MITCPRCGALAVEPHLCVGTLANCTACRAHQACRYHAAIALGPTECERLATALDRYLHGEGTAGDCLVLDRLRQALRAGAGRS